MCTHLLCSVFCYVLLWAFVVWVAVVYWKVSINIACLAMIMIIMRLLYYTLCSLRYRMKLIWKTRKLYARLWLSFTSECNWVIHFISWFFTNVSVASSHHYFVKIVSSLTTGIMMHDALILSHHKWHPFFVTWETIISRSDYLVCWDFEKNLVVAPELIKKNLSQRNDLVLKPPRGTRTLITMYW